MPRTWQERQDSNPRPSVLETDALPTELRSCALKNLQGRAVRAMQAVVGGCASWTRTWLDFSAPIESGSIAVMVKAACKPSSVSA